MTARRHYAVIERSHAVRGGGSIMSLWTYRSACGRDVDDPCDDPRRVDCRSCLRSLARDLLPVCGHGPSSRHTHRHDEVTP